MWVGAPAPEAGPGRVQHAAALSAGAGRPGASNAGARGTRGGLERGAPAARCINPYHIHTYHTHKVQHTYMARVPDPGVPRSRPHRVLLHNLLHAQSLTYYEKWAAALTAICIERGTLTRDELDAALGPLQLDPTVQ